jgi:hypothetical protein
MAAARLGDGGRSRVLLIPLLLLFLLILRLLLLQLGPLLLFLFVLLLRILLCGIRAGVGQCRRGKRHKQEREESDSCKSFHRVTANLTLTVFYSDSWVLQPKYYTQVQ